MARHQRLSAASLWEPSPTSLVDATTGCSSPPLATAGAHAARHQARSHCRVRRAALPIICQSLGPDIVSPNGYAHIEQFGLEGSTPVWTYTFADAVLENASGCRLAQIQLTYATTLCAGLGRWHSSSTRSSTIATISHMRLPLPTWPSRTVDGGLQLTGAVGMAPYYVYSDRGSVQPRYIWQKKFCAAIEHYRRTGDHDDNLLAGTFSAVLEPGESLTLVATTDAAPDLDGQTA